MNSLILIVFGILMILIYRKEGGFNRNLGIVILLIGIAIPAVGFISANQELKEKRNAMILYHSGDYEGAIKVFEKWVQKGRMMKLDSALYLSKSYEHIGDRKRANEYYEIAYELFNKDKELLTRSYPNLEVFWRERSESFEKYLREGGK